MSKIKMLRKEAQVALPNSGETYIAEDGTVSMVLDDNHDNTYEPSEQEINEYAEWLGMSLPEDVELLWVAKEGLKAPLPKEWKPCKTDSGEVYYFNFKTGDSIWDHPMDEHFKNKFKAEKERLRKIKESGGTYTDALSKLPSRNNIVFTDRGVVKHETVVSPVSTPRSTGSSEEKQTPVSRSTPAAASATSAPSSTTKADAGAAKVPIANTTTTTPTTTVAPAMLRKDSSGTYSTTIASASSTVSTPRAVPAEHHEMQQPSPAADPQPESPRLVSEAERILQDRIRQEVEAEHKKKLAAMEEAFSSQSDALRKTHDDDLSETKRQSNVNKRNQINKIEDALQEELEQQQRNVDQRSKRDIQKLQEDIEATRERTRDIQTSASHRVESEVRDVEKRTVEALHAKVADIESEIASIRVRHAKAQADALEQEQQRLELEVNRTSVDVRERANADYEARAHQLRAQHDETVARLRAEAQREMDDESRRAASASAGGNQDTVCAELRQKQQSEVERIRQRSNDDIAAFRAAEESRRATMRAQGEAEISLLLRTDAGAGGGSLADQEALAQIDADADSKIRSAHDAAAASRAAWMQSAALVREQAVRSAAASSSGGGSAANANAVEEETRRLTAETASLVAAAKQANDAEVATLSAALDRERALASEGDLRSAVLAAVQSDLDAYISAEQRQRKDDEERFQASKREAEERHSALLAAYDANVKAVHNTAPPTTIQHVTIPARAATIAAAAAPAADDAMRSMRSKLEQQFEADSRRVRMEASSAHSEAMLRLADELVALEQQKRRSIDAALTAEAASYEQAALAAARASPAPASTQPAAAGGVTLVELEERLENIRSEYRQREAAIRAEMQARIESSRVVASSTRSAIAALRAKMAETSAPSTPEPQGRPPPAVPAAAASGPHQFANKPPQPSDAFDFLQEQQKGLTARQETLAQARAEWQQDVHQLGSTGGGDGAAEVALRNANRELVDQEQMLTKDVHSLRALEKYYSSQVASGARRHHADPTSDAAMGPPNDASGGGVNAQIVLALQHLNQKLEHLSNRVATISSGGGGGGAAAPRTRSHHRRDDEHHRGKHHHHTSSPKAHHRRSTSCDVADNNKSKRRDSGAVELASKWGAILQDVAGKSKSSKMPSYEDAVRQYLHGE